MTSLLVVTSLPVLIQFGGKHLKESFGMLFISISNILFKANLIFLPCHKCIMISIYIAIVLPGLFI